MHTHTHIHSPIFGFDSHWERGCGETEDWIPIVGNQDTIFRFFFPLGIIFPAEQALQYLYICVCVYVHHGTPSSSSAPLNWYTTPENEEPKPNQTKPNETELSQAAHWIWTLPICEQRKSAVIIIESWAWTRALSLSPSLCLSFVCSRTRTVYLYIAKKINNNKKGMRCANQAAKYRLDNTTHQAKRSARCAFGGGRSDGGTKSATAIAKQPLKS